MHQGGVAAVCSVPRTCVIDVNLDRRDRRRVGRAEMSRLQIVMLGTSREGDHRM